MVSRWLMPLLLASLVGPVGGLDVGDRQRRVLHREVLRYEWDLGGFLGTVASLFIPGKGEGTLETRLLADGSLVSELRVTSPASRAEEFWLYGAELEPEGPTTLRVWSAYRFRGKEKEQSQDLDEGDVVDVASGIYQLRRSPPDEARPMRIWSSGKIYAVEARQVGVETRSLDGREVAVRHLRIEGTRAIEGREWQGRLDLFLADDEAATPVEIVIRRDFARVRLVLVGHQDGDS